MKCQYCGQEVTKTQLKYGDANPVKRDASGKIVDRAFHHQCLIDAFENDRHAIQHEKDRREGETIVQEMVKASCAGRCTSVTRPH